MFDRFRNHLVESGLIPPGSRVLVGYSGGADSTALLHLLVRCEIDVVAAHLHHGQRVEAEDELLRCEAFAKVLGVPFMAGRANVPKISAEMRMGLEQAGREARYAFFNEAAFGMDCNLIATAHTLTDHAETILLNISRGTGISGLSGIPESRDKIVRPLLPFTREETKTYCKDYEFWTHDDPANTDPAFSRARVRSNVIPELKQINPAFEQAILRLSIVAEEEDRFLNGMAAASLEQAEIPLNGDLGFLTDDVEMRFDRLKIAHLPPTLKKRALRLATEVLGATLSFEQTQVASLGIAGESTGAITADGGEVVIEWDVHSIDVRRLQPTIPFRFGITLPGETMSEEFGWQFTAFEADAEGQIPKRAALETVIDPSRTKGPLHFRTLKSGDMMQPLGFSGRRKLSDLLSEAKLSSAARARLPIVCDMIGPVWAPGVCLDERVRPLESASRVIVLRFGTLRP